jgi:diguanylate cyclase (GGDEF)-like protein
VNDRDADYLAAATRRIDRLLGSRGAEPLAPTGLSPELAAFAEAFDRLLVQLAALRRLSASLANGDLSQEAPPRQHLLDPLKQVQGNLRHLTWQAQQIAAGDLDQKVDFLGEFSDAFNSMIQGLREKRVVEERIRYMSEHDALTGLYNRAWFDVRVQQLKEHGAGFPVSLLMADLDGLKAVNDSNGHAAGDALIKQAGQVIERALGAGEAVARLGGDEFAIILCDTDAAGAEAALERIRAALRNGTRNEPEPAVSLSLGAGTAAAPPTLEAALHAADAAMYQDKIARRQGRGQRGEAAQRGGGASAPGEPF